MTTPLTDEEIIVKIQSGHRELFSQIITRYQDKLVRYATYILRDSDLAQDAVQQGLIKGYINLQSFNPSKKFSSWIYRLVHNESINLIRKNPKLLQLDIKFDHPSSEDIEQDLIRREVIADIHRCLNQIPLMYSEPITLYYLDHKSYEEIGDILHLPTGTVGTRINRGKSIMKTLCQNQK